MDTSRMEVKAPTWGAASALRQVHHVELLAVHVPGLLDGQRLARLLLEGVHEEHLVLAPFPLRVELLAVGGRVLAHGCVGCDLLGLLTAVVGQGAKRVSA